MTVATVLDTVWWSPIPIVQCAYSVSRRIEYLNHHHMVFAQIWMVNHTYTNVNIYEVISVCCVALLADSDTTFLQGCNHCTTFLGVTLNISTTMIQFSFLTWMINNPNCALMV